MTEFFESPFTGEQISIEQKPSCYTGHKTKNPRGVRGRDRKPRRMSPRSLKNLWWNKRKEKANF